MPWAALVAALGLAIVGPVARGLGSAGSVLAAVALVVGSAAVLTALGPVRFRPASWVTLGSLVVVAVVSVLAWRRGFAYPWAVSAASSVPAFGSTVRWSILPSGPQRTRRLAGPAIGLLVVSGWSWYRSGSVVTVALLLGAALVVLECWSRFPAVADRVDGAIEHGARRLGDGIGAVLSWVVLVVFVWPVHLLSRLVGYSPLASGRSAPGSRWVPVGADRTRSPDGAPLRPDSMAAPELRPSRAVRRRSRLRLLPVFAVGLAVLVAVWPWTVDWPWSDGGEPVAGDAGTFTRSFEDDPAFADAPWAANVRLSLLDAWNNLEFNAAEGGWSIRDITSDHVNVTGGERLSVAPDPGLGDPVVVWLVGASAAFGAGQRDDHTIASELVRRAGRDGIPLEVRNLAVPATVNWQTATQLTSRLLWDDPPDLVVVYDGANDLSLQESLVARGLGDSDRPASLVDEEFDRILRERASAGGAGAALPEPVENSSTGPVPTGDELAARVVTRYGRGLELIRRSAAAADVPVVVFWQPDLRAKSPVTDADRETLRAVGLDESSVERWRALADGVRRELPALGVVDLTSVYDGRSEPIYWDTVHTNEVGSLLVADAIYAGILPEVAAARSRSGG